MSSYPDTRNGPGYSKTVEIQSENLKPGGRDANGFDQFEYFDNVPFLVTKTTYNMIGDEGYWSNKISDLESAYQSISTILTGVFIESVNVSGGFFLIEGDEYFAGSYTEADYGTNTPVKPPEEFKIIESESANISPQGYLPGSNDAIYNAKSVAPTRSRNSTLELKKAESMKLFDAHPVDADYILTSLGFSNPRKIGGTMYVDANLTYTKNESDIEII